MQASEEKPLHPIKKYVISTGGGAFAVVERPLYSIFASASALPRQHPKNALVARSNR
jgi:hypothetical protein